MMFLLLWLGLGFLWSGYATTINDVYRWEAEGNIECLIAALKDKDSDVRNAAAWSLGRLGDKRAVEPFIAALKDKDSNVREAAAEALGELGDKRAVKPLLTALKKDKDSNVRDAAAKALGKLGKIDL